MWKRGAVTKAGSQGSAGFADITKEKIENGVAAPAMEGGQGKPGLYEILSKVK